MLVKERRAAGEILRSSVPYPCGEEFSLARKFSSCVGLCSGARDRGDRTDRNRTEQEHDRTGKEKNRRTKTE